MPHLLNWLYTGISWVLLRWHELFSQVLTPNGGWAWALSICFLVITIRLILFPLFVKQFHSMRKMQALQPRLAEVKKKHANDRQAQGKAVMDLQREAGVNPLGGCLPLVVQAPVFISLYHVLRRLRPGAHALYGWTQGQTDSAVDAKFFGAPIPASFRSTSTFLHQLSADPTSTRVVIGILLLVSCVATFTTQWQNYIRNKDNLDGQQATIQKLMLWVVPIGLAFSGLVFGLPLGVLLYWLTNNLWTMGQQFYMLTRVTPRLEAAGAAAPVVAAISAPRPGAKPRRDQRGRTIVRAAGAGVDTTTAPDGGRAGSAGSDAAASSADADPARRPTSTAAGGKPRSQQAAQRRSGGPPRQPQNRKKKQR
ncbi:MAG: membrane protein insertase YidC [Mycobacteriales bacterium]